MGGMMPVQAANRIPGTPGLQQVHMAGQAMPQMPVGTAVQMYNDVHDAAAAQAQEEQMMYMHPEEMMMMEEEYYEQEPQAAPTLAQAAELERMPDHLFKK